MNRAPSAAAEGGAGTEAGLMSGGPTTGRMDRLADWMFRRYRRHYTLAIIAMSGVFILVTVGVPAAIGMAWWLDLRVTEFVSLGAVIAAIITFAAGAATVTRRTTTLGPVQRWVRGDHSDPVAAWRAVQRMPLEGGLLATIFAVPLAFVVAVFLTSVLDVAEGMGWFTIGLAACVAVVAAAGVAAIGMPTLLRPLGKELSAFVPLEETGVAWSLPIVSRLLLGVVAVVPTSLLLGGAAVIQADGRPAQLHVALLAAALLTTHLAFVSYFSFFRPTLQPIDDLTEAALRIGRGDLDQHIAVTTADEFGRLAIAFNEMQQGLRERERLRSAFGSYVDPALAGRLLQEGSELFEGEDVDATVFFADIREFTPYAERVGARTTVARLNELFGLIVPILHDHGGHANKFTGDGLLAAFGVPGRIADHADRAVDAAVDIQRTTAERFGDGLRLGIGIHTGPVIAGTVGGGGKLEFSLIGDTVNTAARVEQLTKATGDLVLMTQATCDALTAPRSDLQRRGDHAVPGKTDDIRVHAVSW